MKESVKELKKVVIIGAGPAGLTAAYQLCKVGIKSLILEKDDSVGGLAKTINYKGYRFDIGGHRFFTKVKSVENLWHEVLGKDLLRRNRLSRIYYNKQLFYYPLRVGNALSRLGFLNSFVVLLSYLKAQVFPQIPEKTFDQWVSNRFGKRLYEIFFKTYTEKVWGMPCTEIRAEWAVQRIKGLSLLTVLKNALIGQSSQNQDAIKSLIDTFHYPRLGPGMMWERTASIVQQRGSEIQLGVDVERILWLNDKVQAVEIKNGDRKEWVEGTHFISTMPIRELVQKFEPALPAEIITAANTLNYRDFLTVVLIIDKPELFPDNWIYIHDINIKVARIQNFKNWSAEMVPDQNKTCLGLEYFCFERDSLWSMSDQELIELGKRELDLLGLTKASLIEDGIVIRVPKAYPVYDLKYRNSLEVVRGFIERFNNLQLVGRNGMHKYNNQDHSMFTAMMAVKNIMGSNYDLWDINSEQEYHEEIVENVRKDHEEFSLISTTQPLIPLQKVEGESVSNEIIINAFAKIDKLAFAIAVGTISGLTIFIATILLIIKGGSVVGPNLQLLEQYFIGYTISLKGAFIGMGYSFLWGFIWGWLFAYFRNLSMGFVIYKTRRKAEYFYYKNLLDYI